MFHVKHILDTVSYTGHSVYLRQSELLTLFWLPTYDTLVMGRVTSIIVQAFPEWGFRAGPSSNQQVHMLYLVSKGTKALHSPEVVIMGGGAVQDAIRDEPPIQAISRDAHSNSQHTCGLNSRVLHWGVVSERLLSLCSHTSVGYCTP